MDRTSILTFDIGTTGNKCTIFDSAGNIKYSVTIPYKTLFPKPGWAEQDPLDFWNSVADGTRMLLEKHPEEASSVAAIGLSGHMNGCIPLDSSGNVLYNDIIHSDCRCGNECKAIARHFGLRDFYSITGNRIDPHYPLPKILWLKRNYRGIYDSAACFVGSKDYIAYMLTGNLGITDFSDASLMGMLDIKKREWSAGIIKELKIAPEKLPEIRRSYQQAGRLSAKAAALLGLKAGIPVAVGGGDGACATRGAGLTKPGQAYNYIGASSWIAALDSKPMLDKHERVFNYYDLGGEQLVACGTVQCAASAYDWVLENIGRPEVEEAARTGKNAYDMLDCLAESIPAGSNGVFFLPWLMGERTPYWDENARGAFLGLSLNSKRGELIRAAYEGIAYALKSVIEVLEENGLKMERLTLLGGGAKSGLWNEIMSDIYQKPLDIHMHPGEATSYGAVMTAGVCAGIFRSFEDAAEAVEYSRHCEPHPYLAEEYRKRYSVYKRFYPRLSPIFKAMSDL